jgi:hypothetical protein
LEVRVPGAAKTYEFSADSVMTVKHVKQQFMEQISAVENRVVFTDASQVLFCSVRLQGLLQDQEILGGVGITSGDTIILL